MVVTISTLSEEEMESRNYRDEFTVEINGKVMLNVYDGEPEDNNLSRNFNNIYGIDKIIKLAFEAGKNGEELTFEYGEITE